MLVSESILTGIKSSGFPHLGNIIAAIKPAIALARDKRRLFLVADMHSFTQSLPLQERRENSLAIAAAWLALGLPDRDILFLQSEVPFVTELAWYFSCIISYNFLLRSHIFKNEKHVGKDINIGTFTYPILMAADILLYKATTVPVGEDQRQHVEIARQIARRYNRLYRANFFPIPVAHIQESFFVPGTDGRKMSKSYNNIISPFWSEKKLKQVIFSITTNSIPVSMPKDAKSCPILSILRRISSPSMILELEEGYKKGGISYKDVKGLLLNQILKVFKKERELFFYYMKNQDYVLSFLESGRKKAHIIAERNMKEIRADLHPKLIRRKGLFSQ